MSSNSQEGRRATALIRASDHAKPKENREVRKQDLENMQQSRNLKSVRAEYLFQSSTSSLELKVGNTPVWQNYNWILKDEYKSEKASGP